MQMQMQLGVASLSAAEIAARCRCASALGEDAGPKLVHLLSELGICAAVFDEVRGLDGRVEATQTSYLLPPPLTFREARVTPYAADLAARLRGSLPVQAARRFVGRSSDDALHVPALLARLHTRASQEPNFGLEPSTRRIARDEHGQLLLGRHGACCVVQMVELSDGRDAIDVFGCAKRPSKLAYAILADALELLRLCVAECAPGAQTEVHVIAPHKDAGLSESLHPDMRPTAPIGVVRAACKAGKTHVFFGGAQQPVGVLLGDEEVRLAALALVKAPASKGGAAAKRAAGSPAGQAGAVRPKAAPLTSANHA